MTHPAPSLDDMTEPTPNLPLLRKVLDHIDAHPEEWNQSAWAQKTDCGTACCIAGHTAVMSGGTLIFQYEDGTVASKVMLPDSRIESIASYAQQELGLTDDEASLIGGLFDTINTRADVQRIAEEIAARAGERL